MKTRICHSFLLVGTCLLTGVLCAAPEQAEKDLFRYPLKEAPAQIWVRGSSTLGRWDCTQDAIDGLAQINISAERLHARIAQLLASSVDESSSASPWHRLESEVRVAIDAHGFNCDNERMKNDLVEAIRADKYPSINYHFTRLDRVSVHFDPDKGHYLKLAVRGELLFGGVQRDTVHTSYLWLTDNSTIEVKGALDLEMSDFGIKPPTALFGLIRAEDRFQVGYHIKLETDAAGGSGMTTSGLYSSFAQSQVNLDLTLTGSPEPF